MTLGAGVLSAEDLRVVRVEEGPVGIHREPQMMAGIALICDPHASDCPGTTLKIHDDVPLR